ncbi:hypothetical protein [Pseudonocardia spinosispora]|uniref:hypothetical protein n=1 Tax=Pseudonocardia spinosispora TaxID=103441 RepID=UPI0004138521|nr:hypothetical protein [Pseudonocardia spinosispora]
MREIRTNVVFGSHDVPGLLLDHSTSREYYPAVFVSAPVPLSVDDVASVLYIVLEPQETADVSAPEARSLVCDITINAGLQGVADMVDTVAKDRRIGDEAAVEHWAECSRLAVAAIAPATRPVSADIPAARSALALAAGSTR